MNATRRDPCKVCGNHLIEHDGKPLDVTCALCASGAESQTLKIKLEVREDTLQVIRDCLHAAEADIDKLRVENEKLRQSPLKQALDAMASAAASHLASEAKGCIEKGLIETIERLKAELGDLVMAVTDLGGKHDEPGWRNLWKARDKARAALDAASAKESIHD
ncbi:hypothetical protein PPUJ13061_55200 [Pseudomonas putida]|uniref:hypothetical protein n=1 Tax=Pseudomonas putida TaxID=303 RepID=UPI000E0D8605|nr:hypothetical protein [Pseudomonas putida]WQE51980.1 hypothetical protein U0028_19115 [Pseudomonas putida]GLO05616.1 hypothetical protein PPUJ13061_55200 [Pseudomonas putida]HDS1009052.1 hypothetical protein [Pseudomonas putida]